MTITPKAIVCVKCNLVIKAAWWRGDCLCEIKGPWCWDCAFLHLCTSELSKLV